MCYFQRGHHTPLESPLIARRLWKHFEKVLSPFVLSSQFLRVGIVILRLNGAQKGGIIVGFFRRSSDPVIVWDNRQ